MNRQRRSSAWVQTELGSERHQRLLADRLDQRGRADVDPRADAVVCRKRDDEVEVSLLGSYNSDAMRLELYLRIRAWEAGWRPTGVEIELVE